MNENIKKILFIASVALNIVFAATYATYKVPLLTGFQPAAPRGPLYQQLNLTPEQLTHFEAERDRFHARLQELGEDIKAKQIELIDLLGATPPEQKDIEQKQEEIQRLQGAVQDRVIAHFLQESSLLTSEQRARFFELIKARIGTSAPVCPPWMKSFEHGRPEVGPK